MKNSNNTFFHHFKRKPKPLNSDIFSFGPILVLIIQNNLDDK